MQIKKATIDNFRNISHAEYDLRRVNLFTGPNQTGKTNTIIAIYWAMTDFMLDGSSDFASIKPLYDTSLKASVTLKFDTGFTLQKTYAEKWTKTRGSEEKTLTGHDTVYFINGIKTSVKEAKKKVRDEFLQGTSETGKFDLLRAIVDPLYCGSKCEWKVLREFIIDLCGDVSPADIATSNPNLAPIMDRLRTDDYNTSTTLKYYKQAVAKDKEVIETNKAKIEGLRTITCPSELDIANAEIALQNIDKSITDIKAGKTAQILDNAEDAVRKARIELREAEQADKDTADAANASINEQIRKADAEMKKLRNEQAEQFQSLSVLRSQLQDAENKERSAKMEVDYQERKLKQLREDYARIARAKAPDAITCPNCGFALNQDEIDKYTAINKEKLAKCATDGKAAAAELDNLKFKLQDVQIDVKQVNEFVESAERDNEKLVAKIKEVSGKLTTLNDQKVGVIESETTKAARLALANAETALNAAKADQTIKSRDIQHRIQTLELEKAVHRQIIGAQEAYRQAQERIAAIEDDTKDVMKHMTDMEQMQMLVQEYIQCRLNLFQKRIEAVFGTRLKIQLIEENIKEGSWNECCIPMIVDKDTPYSDGSGSEKIITGIYIAECIKKHLNLEDLPYIFDECDKLDSAHLGALETHSQLISTIVNDRDYKKITLVTSD